MRRHRVLTQSPPRQVAHLRLQAARQMAWSEAHGLGSTWAGSCISSSGRMGSSGITHTTLLTGPTVACELGSNTIRPADLPAVPVG